MKLLIPMAGAGSRFKDAGYRLSKPLIPTTDRRSGKPVAMVVAAANDLINGQNISKSIFVQRDFHREDGISDILNSQFPSAEFIILNELSQGQASSCLMAKAQINDDESLLIGACDNGLEYPLDVFSRLQQQNDAIIFTYRNHESVLAKPEAHGWVVVDPESLSATRVSVKIPISETPLQDHAIVGCFWFRRGRDFVAAAEALVADDERVNGEFYVDQVMQRAIERGLRVGVCEVSRYFGWGTPADYEQYENTIRYWRGFVEREQWL